MRKQNECEHKYCYFAFTAYLKGVLWSLDIPQSAPQQQISDNVNTDELFISKGHLKIQREIAHEDTCTKRPSPDKCQLSVSHWQTHVCNTIICNAVCGKFAGHTLVETFKAVPFWSTLWHKRHSSVVNIQGRLRAERLTIRGSLPGMGKRFLSSLNLQFRPALVTTQLRIQWVPGPFPQRSAALNWNWQLTTPSSEVNNDWSYTPNSHYAFTACTKTNILHFYFDAGVNVKRGIWLRY